MLNCFSPDKKSPSELTSDKRPLKLKNPTELIAQIKDKTKADSQQHNESRPLLRPNLTVKSSININPHDLAMFPFSNLDLTDYPAPNSNQAPICHDDEFDILNSSPVLEQTTKQTKSYDSDSIIDLCSESGDDADKSSSLQKIMTLQGVELAPAHPPLMRFQTAETAPAHPPLMRFQTAETAPAHPPLRRFLTAPNYWEDPEIRTPTVFYTHFKTAIEDNPQHCDDFISYLRCHNYSRSEAIQMRDLLLNKTTDGFFLSTLALVNGRFKVSVQIVHYLHWSQMFVSRDIRRSYSDIIGDMFDFPGDYFCNHLDAIMKQLNEFAKHTSLLDHKPSLFFARMLTRFRHSDAYRLFGATAPLDFVWDNESLALLGHEAIMSNQQDIVKKLNKKCLQINSTPLLHVMAQNPSCPPSFLKIFNEKGAAPFKQKAHGMTPVMFAARSGNREFFDHLDAKLDLAEPVHTDRHGDNLLHLTVKARKYFVTRYLVKISRSKSALSCEKS